MVVTSDNASNDEYISSLRAWREQRSGSSKKNRSHGAFQVTTKPQTIQPQDPTLIVQQRHLVSQKNGVDEYTELVKGGVRHCEIGDYPAALIHLQIALKMQWNLHGESHVVVAHTLANIGAVFLRQGQMELASQALEMSLQIKNHLREECQTGRDKHNIPTTDVLNNLGNLAYLSGNYDQSLDYYLQAIQELEASSIRDRELANAMHNVGRIYIVQQKWQMAADIMTKCLRLEEELDGPETTQIAESMELLGYARLSQNSFDEALELFSDALAIHQRVLGPVHAQVGTALVNIAMVMEGKGDLKNAYETFATAREVFKKLGIEGEHRGYQAANRSCENIKLKILADRRRDAQMVKAAFIPIRAKDERESSFPATSRYNQNEERV